MKKVPGDDDNEVNEIDRSRFMYTLATKRLHDLIERIEVALSE